MRHPRVKRDHQDAWHHGYNRTVGTRQDRPFGPLEKEQFVRLLQRVSILYTVRVTAYEVMSNHFHLLLHVPGDKPSEEEICKRFAAFHQGRRTLSPGTRSCRLWQERARDVSWFMRHLQHLYTVWYNRTRPVRRRGPLWADRFKNTVLEQGSAVWGCWKYIENNAVRAGMVQRAADYRFGSYGVWCQSGQHPFEQNAQEVLFPVMQGVTGAASLEELRTRLGEALEQGAPAEGQRRVRYWTCGMVIGSALFVRDVMGRYRDEADRRRLLPVKEADPGLCAWRCVRADTV